MDINELQNTIKHLNYILSEIHKEQKTFENHAFGAITDKEVLGIYSTKLNSTTQTTLPFEAVAEDLQKIEEARESIRQTLRAYQARLVAKLDAVNELLKEE